MPMNLEQFGQTIKQKHPEYNDIPDGDLGKRVLDKYPQYQDMVSFSENKVEAPVVQKKGFIQGVSDVIAKRTQNVERAADIYGAGKQSLPEAAFQAVGQSAGGLADIGFEALKAITPKPIKETIKSAGSAILDTAIGKQGLEAAKKGVDVYDQWKQKNPRTAANLEAAVNIASVIPSVKGVGIGVESLGKIAGKTAGTLEKGAKEASTAIKNTYVKKLVQPVQTSAVRESQVARTTETGGGIFKKSVVQPTQSELRQEKVLMEIPGISEKNTYQQNYNIIKSEVEKSAQKLESDIKNHNFIVPKKEVLSRLKTAQQMMSDSPVLVGDAKKTAEKLVLGMQRFINSNTGNAAGLLKARKQYDQWVLSQKPKAFDAKTESAFSIANRSIRGVINEMLEEKAPSVGVRESLSRQHALFDAMDTITPKAAKEADTTIGRAMQKAEQILGTKNRAVQIAATAVGIGGLGAAATFAPAIAQVGIPLFFVYKGGKYLMSPKVKNAIAGVLREIEKQSKQITNPIIIKELDELNSELKKSLINYAENPKIGLSLQDVSKNLTDSQTKSGKAGEALIKGGQKLQSIFPKDRGAILPTKIRKIEDARLKSWFEGPEGEIDVAKITQRLAEKHKGKYDIHIVEGEGKGFIESALKPGALPQYIQNIIQKGVKKGYYENIDDVHGLSFPYGMGGKRPIILSKGPYIEQRTYHEIGHHIGERMPKESKELLKEIDYNKAKQIGLIGSEFAESPKETIAGVIRVFYSGTKEQRIIAGDLLKKYGMLSIIPMFIPYKDQR